ncbi:DUF1778 domain-containing protein [Testudinibacter sp. TR-2022]|nr:DUF1778 domain-containing protein [Pasteurellaceae bacterium Phil11]TNH23242.1 DUF1778 domain-containing protein [Testudinibacter sp. TR-2022]TNH29128.1 DUF1778 domain-containing protein [Testudinibacter sp. TR-2022]
MMMTINSARLEARISKDLHTLIKHAAQLEGRSLTDFIITAVQSAAQKTITDTQVLQLSINDQVRFAEALFLPPAHNSAMEKALEQHHHLLEK